MKFLEPEQIWGSRLPVCCFKKLKRDISCMTCCFMVSIPMSVQMFFIWKIDSTSLWRWMWKSKIVASWFLFPCLFRCSLNEKLTPLHFDVECGNLKLSEYLILKPKETKGGYLTWKPKETPKLAITWFLNLQTCYVYLYL